MFYLYYQADFRQITGILTFATAIGAPAGIIVASCGLTFLITSGFVKGFKNNKK